jgi:hypothetical protein
MPRWWLVASTAVVLASATVLAAWLWDAWDRSASPADLPAPREIERIEVTLWGSQIGRKDLVGCKVDPKYYNIIIRCLIPSEESRAAGEMLVLPRLGELRILASDGRTRRIVFVDAGKNPLCFELDGRAYLRGGRRYSHYAEDHRDLYDLPAETIDEARMFMKKLVWICEFSRLRALLEL